MAISPNPFPANGIRSLSRVEYLARQKAIACALPKDNSPSCTGQVYVGIFFDGTGNHLRNDYEVPPPEKRKHTHAFTCLYRLFQAALLMFMLSLTACGQSGEEQARTAAVEPTTYLPENYTDKNIISIIVNGEGGVAGVKAHSESSGDCCVFLPRKWHPGIKVKIKWQLGGTYQLDSNGKKVIEDGVPVVIDGDWKEKTVEVPKYVGKDEEGYLLIYFFPNDEVQVLRTRGEPCEAEYGEPVPDTYKTICSEIQHYKAIEQQNRSK